MRKIMSIAATLAVMMSLSACTTGNTAMENRNNGTNNGTGYQVRNAQMDNTNNDINYGSGYQTRNVGLNNSNTGRINGGTNIGRTSSNMINAGTYRDGIYAGLSDSTTNGFESAIITISNGEIASIELNTVNQHEAAKDENTMATGNNGATGGRIMIALDGTQIGTSNGLNNTNATGTRTELNTTPKQTTVDPSWSAFDKAKATIINTVIQTQNPNVAVNESDTTIRNRMDGWRQAIGRAVSQATR
jgi:hypothetical protein